MVSPKSWLQEYYCLGAQSGLAQACKYTHSLQSFVRFNKLNRIKALKEEKEGKLLIKEQVFN